MKITSELKIFQKHTSLYEKVVADIIKNVPRGGVMIDGGSHVGDHTSAMLARADVDIVYAVEAIPALQDYITKRFAGDVRLRIISGAISNFDGRANFSIAVNAMGYSGLFERDLDAVSKWEAIDVNVYTLDNIVDLDDSCRVGLIKLDLEGGEFNALQGAHDLILNSRPVIIFENGLRSPASDYNYEWLDFKNFFDEQNYELQDFFGNSVDNTYWDSVLQTYMFVAYPKRSIEEQWLAKHLPIIVTRFANEVL